MPSLDVSGLLFDDENLPKLAQHQVTIKEAYQVLWTEPKGFRNHSEGAPWILIGPTYSGRMITLPIDPTRTPGIWRPRTAYESSAKEMRRYAKE